MRLLKRFKKLYNNNPFIINTLYSSFNDKFGTWSSEKNNNIFKEIDKL